MAPPGKKTRSVDYRLGKKLAVAVAKRLLPQQDQVFQDQFHAEKKKDDLADCFLQAQYVATQMMEGKF